MRPERWSRGRGCQAEELECQETHYFLKNIQMNWVGRNRLEQENSRYMLVKLKEQKKKPQNSAFRNVDCKS